MLMFYDIFIIFQIPSWLDTGNIPFEDLVSKFLISGMISLWNMKSQLLCKNLNSCTKEMLKSAALNRSGKGQIVPNNDKIAFLIWKKSELKILPIDECSWKNWKNFAFWIWKIRKILPESNIFQFLTPGPFNNANCSSLN